MKRIIYIILIVSFCFSLALCVFAGDGGDMPDPDAEKDKYGSYFDKLKDSFFAVDPVMPHVPREDYSGLWAMSDRTLAIASLLIAQIEVCVCSAIMVPYLADRLNLDDNYTLKSGSYWLVKVN